MKSVAGDAGSLVEERKHIATQHAARTAFKWGPSLIWFRQAVFSLSPPPPPPLLLKDCHSLNAPPSLSNPTPNANANPKAYNPIKEPSINPALPEDYA
jgi:hypothetical protein